MVCRWARLLTCLNFIEMKEPPHKITEKQQIIRYNKVWAALLLPLFNREASIHVSLNIDSHLFVALEITRWWYNTTKNFPWRWACLLNISTSGSDGIWWFGLFIQTHKTKVQGFMLTFVNQYSFHALRHHLLPRSRCTYVFCSRHTNTGVWRITCSLIFLWCVFLSTSCDVNLMYVSLH